MNTREPASLDLRRLGVTIDDQQCLRDVELSVLPGELLFVVGRQGAGKSSLLHAIAGLGGAVSGEVWVDAREISALPPAAREVALLSQDFPLWPHLDVGRNIAFALHDARTAETRQRVAQALDAMGLADFGRHLPAQLTPSQRQRVALARTLCADTRLLLLDEPLSQQETCLRERLMHGLKRRLQQAGITALISSDDPREALRFADRIALLHEGELLQTGSPRELYDTPANRRVAEFFGNVNLIDGEIEYAGEQPLFRADNGVVFPVFERATRRPRMGSAMFRPHQLHIMAESDAPFGDRIRLSGRVEYREFHGDTIRYGVAVSGETLCIDLPSDHADDLEIGDPVVLGIDPAQVRILRR